MTCPRQIRRTVLALLLASHLSRKPALDPISGTRANSLSAVAVSPGTEKFPPSPRDAFQLEIAIAQPADLDIPGARSVNETSSRKTAAGVNEREVIRGGSFRRAAS